MNRLVTISLVFLLVLGCREPFDFNYQDVEEPRVVIEGFISDRATAHAIKVSYSTNIDERGVIDTRFVSDAQVRIEDDQGGFTSLTHFEAGIYLTAPQYRAQEGRAYTLVVNMPNGEEYRSAVKNMPLPGSATAQLSFRPESRSVLSNNQLSEENGARISVTIDKGGERHFYQWLLPHYYIYEAALVPEDSPIKFCYVRDFDATRIDVLQDNPVSEGASDRYTYDIDFVPITSRTEFDYGVEGRLLTMHEEDYNFWERVKRLSENTGGLFDAALFSLEGNVSNSGTGALALGYFGVYRETVDRVFFNQQELGFGFTDFPKCNGQNLPPSCFDCTAFITQQNFGITPPDWWRN